MFNGDFDRENKDYRIENQLRAGIVNEDPNHITQEFLRKFPWIVRAEKRRSLEEIEEKNPGFKENTKVFLEGKAQNFLILGQVGNGKTSACYSVLVAASSMLKNDRYIKIEQTRYLDLLITFSASAGNNEYDKMKFESYKRCDILYIDDFGRVPITTENKFNGLIDIIDERSAKGKKTLISSNHMTTESFISAIGDAIYSKITEDAIVQKFVGLSFRKLLKF